MCLCFLLIVHVPYTDDIEFEELEGNGICTESGGFSSAARIHYIGMSHEEARKICRFDDKCVAYAYSLDNYLAKVGNSAILYTTTHCTDNCAVLSWLNDPNLIQKASNPQNNPNWVTGKCYVKRNQAQMVDKCFAPPLPGK